MADRQSKNIKTGEDDIRNTSTKSDFLSVVGNSTFLSVSGNGEYLDVTGRGSSTVSSDTTFLQQSAADEGPSFIHSTLTHDPEGGSDDDPEKGSDYDPEKEFDHVNMHLLEPKDTTPLNEPHKCSKCAANEKHIQATHFCRSCRTNGIYICYTCLQSHNRWHHDHTVYTLSVSDTR